MWLNFSYKYWAYHFSSEAHIICSEASTVHAHMRISSLGKGRYWPDSQPGSQLLIPLCKDKTHATLPLQGHMQYFLIFAQENTWKSKAVCFTKNVSKLSLWKFYPECKALLRMVQPIQHLVELCIVQEQLNLLKWTYCISMTHCNSCDMIKFISMCFAE